MFMMMMMMEFVYTQYTYDQEIWNDTTESHVCTNSS